jgi:uncharacterized membrane protein (GlpM family)
MNAMDWACKAMLTATTVALLLALSQSFGSRIAGLIAGLPTVTGPALIWLAHEFGSDYAAQAAIGAVAACACCAIFSAGYEFASRHRGVACALAFATLVAAIAAAPLEVLAGELTWALLVTRLIPETAASGAAARSMPGELWLTASVAGVVSGAVAWAAPGIGPFWAGVLASPPLIAAAVAMHQHAHGARVSMRRFLRGYVVGLSGRALFAALFALLITRVGALPAALLAVAATWMFATALLRKAPAFAPQAVSDPARSRSNP